MKTSVPFTQLVTSPTLRATNRLVRAGVRKVTGQPKRLLAFLEPGEPNSELLAQILPEFCKHYNLQLARHIVGPPSSSSAPEPERLRQFSIDDTAHLRQAFGISPSTEPLIVSDGKEQHNERLRRKLGHYASGALYFEGEWYPGLDRLYHLEKRLGAQSKDCLYGLPAETENTTGGQFDMYFSLRSPYSYIALMRIQHLCDTWNARVNLRPVLPMVMRNLPVPPAKRLYILRDTKREAERFKLPFGKIADPVGAGVERALAVYYFAETQNAGLAFLHSYSQAVWTQGIDPATDKGLKFITKRANLNWADVKIALKDQTWRDKVEDNRKSLFEIGLWGVPSFKVNDKVTFGQDRLWLVGHWLGNTSK